MRTFKCRVGKADQISAWIIVNTQSCRLIDGQPTWASIENDKGKARVLHGVEVKFSGAPAQDFSQAHSCGRGFIDHRMDVMSDSNRNSAPKRLSDDRRILAVGDIHGCARELEALLGEMAVTRDDLVVFLGDYIDRGPDARHVIDIILDLGRDTDVVGLKGNHEALFLDFLDHPESVGAGLFVLNGGTTTLANYAYSDGTIEIPDTHLNFFRNLRLCYETDAYFFVHAGVPDRPLSSLVPEEHELALLWSRYPFLSSDYKWEKTIVHGHTPVREAEILANRINIDTGCVYDGRLTGIELPSGRLFQVDKGMKNEDPVYPREMQSTRISMRFSGRIPVLAGKPGEAMIPFVTMNYNQFGLLMYAAGVDEEKVDLEIGDPIEGQIGEDPTSSVRFIGVVARVESRGAVSVFGIKIERISGEIGGPEWIERPKD